MTLHDEAFELIKARDAVEGESWSNDTESIADMIVDFHKKKCKEQKLMSSVVEQGKENNE